MSSYEYGKRTIDHHVGTEMLLSTAFVGGLGVGVALSHPMRPARATSVRPYKRVRPFNPVLPETYRYDQQPQTRTVARAYARDIPSCCYFYKIDAFARPPGWPQKILVILWESLHDLHPVPSIPLYCVQYFLIYALWTAFSRTFMMKSIVHRPGLPSRADPWTQSASLSSPSAMSVWPPLGKMSF